MALTHEYWLCVATAPPVDGRVGADGCYGRPHVLQVPHLDSAVVAPGDHVVARREHRRGHRAEGHRGHVGGELLYVCRSIDLDIYRPRCVLVYILCVSLEDVDRVDGWSLGVDL